MLAGASLLAMATCALADPIFTPLTFFLFSAAPVWISPALIYGALQIAAVAGLAAAQALGRRQPRIDPQEIKNTTRGSEGPGRYATGRVMLGGRIAFGNTAGYDIYRLILHCFGPIDAIEEYFYDGRSIVVESNGAVSTPPWVRSGGSNMYVLSKLGTGGETAWTQLTGDFPGVWTSDHRVRGIGQTLLRVINPGFDSEEKNKRFQKLLQGGVKELEVLARVGSFYDPRTEQSPWTLNGVIQCLHWYRQLPDMRDDLIDFADIASIANQADALVPVLGGTAPRCTISGGWEGPLTVDVVSKMLESAGLEWRRVGSKHTFRFIEDDPEPELTLYSRHIIDREFTAVEAVQRPNVCRISYYSHERQGDLAEIDLSGAFWARVPADIERYGEKEKLYELPFCDNASQAQRIGRRLFWMDRAQTGIIRTTFAGIAVAAFGLRTLLIEVPDVGTDGDSTFIKCRVIAPVRINDAEGTCEIPVAIIPDELKVPWDPETMEQPAPPVLPEFEYESDLPKPATPAEATVVQYPGGGGYETRVRFTGVSGGTVAEARYRTYTDGNPNLWQSMTEYQGSGNTWYGWDAADARGERADFRTQFFNSDDEGSYPSDILTVEPMGIDNTAPGAPTVSVSVDSPGGGANADVTWTITVPDLNAVKVTVETFAAIPTPTWTVVGTINNIRPGVEREIQGTLPAGSSVSYRVAAYTSNDTRGAYAMGVVNVPGGND